MGCGSCGKSKPLRISRTTIHTAPYRVATTPRLGSRKLVARKPVSLKPANHLDRYRK
jgi:hypothetical protein